CRSALACQPRRRKSADADKAVYLPLRSVCAAGSDSACGDGHYCMSSACQAKKSCSMSTLGDCGPGEECNFGASDSGSGSEGFCESANSVTTQTAAGKSNESASAETGDTVASATSATPAAGSNSSEQPTDSAAVSGTTAPPATTPSKREQLIVSAGSNRTIELPLNSIELHASIIPEPTGAAAKRLAYSWKVISGPRKGQFQNRNTASLKLSELVEGKYVLQVDVTDKTDSNRVGKAVVMVTVKPAKHKSKPPKAVIKPASLSIQLPNNVILDGSGSVDGDQKIESYHWQVVDGPLTAQDLHSVSQDQQILQLNKLKAGFYVIRLTVQDAKGLSDSATANITVIPEPDDKPKASAGQSSVIYLPQNNITLYGNASTDDHGIVSYMWRQKGGSHLSADMQGVHTPVLHLSGLVEGDYAFELTVTDARGQTDSATVNVLVKRRPKNALPVVTLLPPELTVELPLTRLVLNASAVDDTGVKSWRWTLLTGPGSAKLANATQPSVTLTNLQAGVYKLRAEAVDLDGGVGSAVVTVTVKPGPNQAPKADAGGDRVVDMDGTGATLVALDGSKSWDDKGIVEYKWTRQDVSLAVGQVLNGSDASPRLLLLGLLPGRYSFRLTVKDSEGATGTADAAILVRPWPHAASVASLELRADPSALRQSDLSNLMSQMQLTLRGPHPGCNLRLLGLRPRQASIVMRLSAGFANGTYLPGPRLAAVLKRRLPATLLEFPVLELHTEVCQLGCSDRGYCDNSTRQCVCASFWMENPLRVRFGDGESNCDWSVVYVSLGVTISLLGFCAAVWLLYCCLRYRRASAAAAAAHLRTGSGSKVRRLRKAAAMMAGGGGSRDKVFYAPLNNGNESGGRMSFSLSSDEEDTVYSRRVASDPSLGGGSGGAGDGGAKADHNSNQIPMASLSNGSVKSEK
uniref:PKD domain-containing protein n=1 Tax=Macrostomum lignano TaxID=282301 RepID=A0A1I8IRZ5_9PLAT